jgi:predicted dehydrogenase
MSDKTVSLTRRRFLGTAAQAGAVLMAPQFIPGRVLGKDGAVAASERITVAGIGIRHRGKHDLGCLMDQPVVQFVAIADPQKVAREDVQKVTEAKYGPGVKMYRDFREMLPREDIDAVLIATGDRWHTMASICAAKAGKDIYCEKPCSVTIAESQALADTMRRYGRIYQAGTQRRSIANFQLATEFCHSGKLGKLVTVHANTLHPATKHDWLDAEP